MHASQVILISFFTSVLTAGATLFAMQRMQVIQYEQALQVDADVAVPELVGLSEKDARANLSAAGLVPVIAVDKESDSVDPGHVVEQIPAAGQFTTKGTPVNLHLAPKTRQVPNVVGRSQDEAKQALEQVGLSYEWGQPIPHATVEKGRVALQEPLEGQSAKSGAKVSLRVSSGPQMVAAPKLMGLNLASAKKKLAEVGLEMGEVGWVHDPDLYPNVIVRQDPRQDEQVAAGSKVAVSVNTE